MEEYWRLHSPAVLGFTTAMLCNVPNDEGRLLPQRPPAIVFKIIWPVLYYFLGYSWQLNSYDYEVDLMHALCTCLLTSWIAIFSCAGNKKLGIYIIACAIATVVCCMSLTDSKTSKIVLAPLLAWLLVAFHLNWHIVDEK